LPSLRSRHIRVMDNTIRALEKVRQTMRRAHAARLRLIRTTRQGECSWDVVLWRLIDFWNAHRARREAANQRRRQHRRPVKESAGNEVAKPLETADNSSEANCPSAAD